METLKRTLLILFVCLLVGGSAYGAFYLLKKYIKQDSGSTQIPISQSTPTLPGLERDLSNKTPAILPKGLIPEKDVLAPIESFTYKQEGKPTQYTYKYSSSKSISQNRLYYEKFATTTPGWTSGGVITNSTSFVSIRALNKSMELIISINADADNKSIVDITAIK